MSHSCIKFSFLTSMECLVKVHKRIYCVKVIFLFGVIVRTAYLFDAILYARFGAADANTT